MSLVHVQPPASLPTAQIGEIIAIVREGRVRSDYKCLIWCCSDVQLYAQSLVLGPPEGHESHSFGSIGDEGEQLDQCCAALTAAHDELTAARFGDAADVALDPATIALIVQAISLAIEFIRRFRKS